VSLFSNKIIVLSEHDTVEHAQNLMLEFQPHYLVVIRIRGKPQHYVFLFELLLDAINKLKPETSSSLQDFLNLREDDADETLEVSSTNLEEEDPKILETISRLTPDKTIVLTRQGSIVGIIDPKSNKPNSVYKIKGRDFEHMRVYYPLADRVFKKIRSTPGIFDKLIGYPKPNPSQEIKKEEGPILSKGITRKRNGESKREHLFERYPSSSFPEKVALGQTTPLQIIVKVTDIQKGLISKKITLVAHEGENEVPLLVLVKCEPSDVLGIVGEYHNEMLVPVAAIDSNPLTFLVKAKKLGSGTIKAEFFQRGTYLGQLELKTQVVEPASLVDHPPSALSDITLKMDPGSIEPDISLIIHELQAQPIYEYDVILLSPKFLMMPYKIVGKINFRTDPENQFREIFQEIENTSSPPDIVEESLMSKGRDLYDKLFPPELKEIYWNFHDKIKSIRIISEEPWVPWEILKPWQRVNGKIQEDGFLCEQYSFSRWLEGKPIKEKNQIKTVKVVVPSDTNLDGALEEFDWIHNFASKVGLVVTRDSSFKEVISSLKNGGFDLLHFSTHGIYNKTYSNQSSIILEDGYGLKPENINGPLMAFGESNPLVILNACQTGQQGFSLTGIGSWAKQFLEAGASGFIGTLWSVSDSTALRFTENLYQKLSSGSTLDKAVRDARNAAREEGDPSWLAYTLYTQPNSKIKLGTK